MTRSPTKRTPLEDKIRHLQLIYLSIYISRLGCSLYKLPLFGLKNYFQTNTWKAKILHISIGILHRMCIYSWQLLNPANHQRNGAASNMGKTTTKNFFHQFEFFDKFKFETKNLRRDTSFPSVIENWRFVGGGSFVSIGKKRKTSNIELFKKLPSLCFSRLWLILGNKTKHTLYQQVRLLGGVSNSAGLVWAGPQTHVSLYKLSEIRKLRASCRFNSGNTGPK